MKDFATPARRPQLSQMIATGMNISDDCAQLKYRSVANINKVKK